ncbi:3'-5' exonuclease [Leptotrichia sp. oral taxon 218]|uniref:3'-5' exonuclease n=1 Tax=Leptotrichia sp. oral taxon 218 TaxID=712361 RepID=UPI001B8B2802|nr:3'-5' exonuclease [Leptotrichia sp. oral taxon 218]QUB96104.1 3'-5' exonuclease [Leptotrichia sp. oral taxon 218]
MNNNKNNNKDLNKNIIFFDVETNGFKGSSVLSMSAIKVNYDFEKSEWSKVSEFNRFYFREEDEEMNEGAINVNGLTDEVIAFERKKLKDKIGEYPLTFKSDMDNFFMFCQDTDHFVAHNISFDRSFVDFSLKNQFDTMKENIDILKIENNCGNYKWPKLIECAKYYKVPFEENQFHGSYYDVLIMFRIFYKMTKNEIAKNRIFNFLEKD